MASNHCVTFLTDYGLEDGFVASCHGVIVGISPTTPIIDITHLVPPGDVRRGAAVLAQTVPHMPPGVHLAIVDPGVGTGRRAVAVSAGESIFVGPDNGLLSWAIHDAGGAGRAIQLTNPELWRKPLSRTFHGRDLFAPVAAHLANGIGLDRVGDEFDIADLVNLPLPAHTIRGATAEGEVVTVDRFGNVQLSLTAEDLDLLGAAPGESLIITFGRLTLTVPYRETFGSVPPGELVSYIDSVGYVALAVNSGNAAQRLGLPPGAHLRLARTPIQPVASPTALPRIQP